jgi:hypothetical protein
MINGQPRLIAQAGGSTLAVIPIDVAHGMIRHVWAVRNPRNSGSARVGDQPCPLKRGNPTLRSDENRNLVAKDGFTQAAGPGSGKYG